MAEFYDLKEKVMSTLGAVADMTKGAAVKTADAAKNMTRIAKLSVEVGSEKDTIKKAYAEIGKIYYDLHKDAPDDLFAQLCEEITLTLKNIEAKEAEIAELKVTSDRNENSDIEVEFEEITEDDYATPATTCTCEAEETPCDCGCNAHTVHAADATCCGCTDEDETEHDNSL